MPFINNSDKTLRIMATSFYNDTIFKGLGNPAIGEIHNKVLPRSKKEAVMIQRSCYENFSYTNIYIFDEQVLETISWNTVGENYMVLQRYDLTPEDLQKLKWQIPYPPTEVMKDMKMYPAYDSEK
jgi:hypothetical protein